MSQERSTAPREGWKFRNVVASLSEEPPGSFLPLGKYILPCMLPVTTYGEGGPLLVMLHWLGGSAKTWTEVSENLSCNGITCVALDMPGFGRAYDAEDNSGIDATVEVVMETIASIRSKSKRPWFLAGHSMGGKLAAIVARAATDGRSGLEDLRGLVLISPSPPSPEPMEKATRRQMIDSLGRSTRSAGEDRHRAEKFIDENTGKLPILESVRDRAADDVLRMNRAAFTNWLTTGSKEDWAARVGVLSLPALIVAGTEESSLGPAAQQNFTMPHFPDATLVTLQGGGHLGPLERPAEIADRIAAFVQSLGLLPAQSSPLSAEFLGLIESPRTSPQTRLVLLQRLADDLVLETDGTLSLEELLILRTAARRILPGCPFDLASRIDSWLALKEHDGWRHNSLPPDIEAWRTGLHSLDSAALHEYGVPFFALDDDRQNELLSKAREGRLEKGFLHSLHLSQDTKVFSDAQMKDWFGDLCAELTKQYIADPRTLCRIGFTGFADEGGFTQIRLNEREEFES